MALSGIRSWPLPRRRALQAGALGLLGLTSAQLRALQAATGDAPSTTRRCVFIFLFGGPSQIDLWDLKPSAPLEVRGEFLPVSTSVPGIQICEHLPLLAQRMHKFCLVRSMTHDMNVHGPACSEIYSGRPYFGPPTTDQARPEDWPSLASLVMRYGASPSGLPASVVLPWYTQFVGQDKRIAGQTGGRMGEQWNPFLVQGDPSQRDFAVQGISLPNDVTAERFHRRGELRRQLAPEWISLRDGLRFERNIQAAQQLVGAREASRAFSLDGEPDSLRQRYGDTSFGQSLLLARRVLEADIPLVTVNWTDDSKDDKVSPHWDTHHDNFTKLKDNLCPPFDRAMSAFLDDLDERGLLESTLIVALGEFGRTPKIGLITQNGMTEKTGRDHWPHAFTALLAGGGLAGGQVIGRTNKTGAFVEDRPVRPNDLSATILHHLGIDPHLKYYDTFQETERVLSTGAVIEELVES